jgi:hypothetical protein
MEKIFELLEAERYMVPRKGANVLVQCGYYETFSSAEAADPFCELTLGLGLELAKEIRARWPGARVQFCTLVNDLGQVCGTEACELPATLSAGDPDAVRRQVAELFVAHGVPAAHHRFFFERTLKNRGLRLLKKQIGAGHPKVQIHEDDTDGSEAIVLRQGPTRSIHLATRRGAALTGKCPVIMSAFYRDALDALGNQFHLDTRPRLVIDLCHTIDREKVLRGIDVLRALDAFAPAGAPGAALLPVFLDDRGEQLLPRFARIPTR